jgi:hypothetical protein
VGCQAISRGLNVTHAQRVRIFDRDVWCLDLPTLIHVKRAAGRPRDIEVVAELEAIAEECTRQLPPTET